MEEDEVIQQTIQDIKAGTTVSKNTALGLCKIENGFLTYEDKIWIPDNPKIRIEILQTNHDSITAGHQGMAKTYEKISRNYYWPHMRKDIERYVKNCDTCQRIKPTNHAPFGLLKPLQAPERPWSSISMDFITGLPESDGHDSIWVVVDRLTKMAYFTPCKETMKAAEFAKLFMNTIFRHHGLPKNIAIDRLSLFTSQYWKELTKYLGIRRNLSTAFHPQTDGQTE